MSTNIFIDDESIDAELTIEEGGPVECNDGTFGFSLITIPCPTGVEIILGEDVLVMMLNEIRAEFGAPDERDEEWED